jgi:AcrR family transcriptional regulator
MATDAASPVDNDSRPRRRYAPRLPPGERREQLLDAALSVIIEEGYGGVSIEAIARAAGVTRPVVYDHFPNLGELLAALLAREESYALATLADVVPDQPGDLEPAALISEGVRRFLDAVTQRPATWRLILLPLDGTPALVRDQVEITRAGTDARIADVVRWIGRQTKIPHDLDVELTARLIRHLGEEAGRTVLMFPDRYPPERYERFVEKLMELVWPADGHGG